MRMRLMRWFVLTASCIGWAPAVGATTLPVASGGLAESFGCTSTSQPFCELFGDFNLQPPLPIKPVTGSLAFSPDLATATSVDITLADLDFAMEGLSGSVARIEFSDVTITLNAPMGVTTAAGIGTDLDVDGLVATATISGNYLQLDSGGGTVVGLTAFSDTSVSIDNFACGLSFAGIGTCGFDLGLSDYFTLDIDGVSHDVVQTYNLNLVPEPGSALLLAAGLLALAAARRGARR